MPTTDVLALAQLAVVQDTAGVGGLAPPDASTEAKLVTVPPDPGAVAVIVNAAVPSADTAGSAADNVTVHVRRAAVEFKFVQLTLVTPAPGVAAVAVTPAGSWSATVAAVVESVPPCRACRPARWPRTLP